MIARAMLLVAAVALIMPLGARAQAYPSRPVRIVVPSGAGGPADLLARIVGERLSRDWGQPVVIDNRPGASQTIGADAVAKAAPDGYTLLLTPDGPITMNPSLFARLPYDPVKDLVPVARLVSIPLILVAHPGLKATRVSDLVALAKAQPGKLNFGAGGSTTRMAAELFRSMTHTDLAYIPYKGSSPMINALIAGEVQVAFDGVPSSLSQIKAGRLRAIAVTGTSRLAALPEVPTVAESGVPGYVAGTWIGLFAPAGVPAAVQARLLADVDRVLARPEVSARLVDLGMATDPASPAEFKASIRADTAKWRDLIQRAGITPDN